MKNPIYIIPILFIILYGCQSPESGKEAISHPKKEKIDSSEGKKIENEQPSVNPQVALYFINSYIQNCNKMNEAIDVVKWVRTSELVTDGFKSELEELVRNGSKENPEMGLGYDPIFNAQDFPEDGVELDTFNKETGIVVLKGVNWESFKITVKLINHSGKTLIDGCGAVNKDEEKNS